MNDWTGNRKTTFSTLGASSHSEHEREKNDYYATDPIAIDLLCGVEKFQTHILEPACGEGHLALQLLKHGYIVSSFDLIDRNFGKQQNFFDFAYWSGDVITNPPYKFAKEFIEHSLKITEVGTKTVMFLKLTFLEGKARKQFFKKYPPKTIYVSSSRIKCALNGNFKDIGSSAVCYAWFVWENGYKGETTIKWIN